MSTIALQRKEAVPLRGRHVAALVMSLVILATAIPDILVASGMSLGWDLTLYREATARWLAGGPFYEPYQLAGPYTVAHGDILYPPVALWLFVPFLALPTILWWLLPAVAVAWSVWKLRPGPLAWPLMALCLAWPPTIVKVAGGNPVMWCVAALALGVVYVGPAVFVLLKPSLFPLALWGANRIRWWAFLALFVAMSLPFGAMWLDWLTTVQNAQGAGLAYSWQEVPMLLLPIVAWVGRAR